MTYGPLTLVVPPGALPRATTITLSEIADPPRGAVGPAYEFAPAGLAFATPATLKVSYDGLGLPPGTEPASLRLSVLDRGRWVPIEGHVNSGVEKRVAGTIAHFSTYGIVPDPREVSGRGTRWEANGIAVDASEEMFARLYVSPTAVSLFLGGETTGPVAITWSGLPTDDDNHLYVDGYDAGVVVRPADGGLATVTVDGRSPHYLWLQPRPGTTIIGGPADQCPSVGVRSGTTCTLTRDIVAGVSIEASGETLDCAGHRIYQPLADRGTGIGVLVGGFGPAGPLDDVTIRNCVVGGPDAGFFEGLAATGTTATRVLDSTFSDNIVAAYLGATTNARIAGNRLDGAGNFGIQMYEGSSDGEIAGNTIALVPGIQPIGIMFKGMEGKLGPIPATRTTVERNAIAGGSVSIGFIFAEGNDVSRNDIDGSRWGLWIGQGGWPNTFWWNNVTATTWGVWAEIGPAEVSDGVGEGNWWNHSCPGPTFTPSVDGNRSDVVDSFAYGFRSGWDSGEQPNCGSGGRNTAICPDDGSEGVYDVVWDDYVPRSPAVRAAWERLSAEILANEAENDSRVRAEWAAKGLFLADKPPVPPIVVWNRDTDNPQVIAGRITRPTTADAHSVVQSFLHANSDLFGSLSSSTTLPDLRLENTFPTSKRTTFTFRQYYRDLPVFNAPMTFIVEADGALTYVSGRYFPLVDVDLRETCNRHDATLAAEAAYDAAWPDAGRTDVEADMVLYAAAGASGSLFFPAWVGSVRERDPGDDSHDAFFIIYARGCTVERFGERGAAVDTVGGAWTTTPSPDFEGFGNPPLPESAPKQIWADYAIRPPRLQSRPYWGNMRKVLNVKLRLGSATYVPANDSGPLPYDPDPSYGGLDGHWWTYPPQQSVDELRAAGCYPTNPGGTSGCDDMYSNIECVTAYSRIQDGMRWYRSLNLGISDRGMLPFSWPLEVNCNDPEYPESEPGYYDNNLIAPNEISLRPFATLSLAGISVMDHEWHHDLIYKFLKARGVMDVCCGLAFESDEGQGAALEEVLPEFLADLRNGQDPGVFYRLFAPSGRPEHRTTFYPSYGTSRRGCVPEPDQREFCENASMRPEGCLRIMEESICTDDYTWAHYPHYESGSTDGHANQNGRVLYQALADFRERFGSLRFSAANGYAGRTTFPASVLTTSGPSAPIDHDWGASHQFDPLSPGWSGCVDEWVGDLIPRHIRRWSQVVTVEEQGVTDRGRMFVSFGRIDLPAGATITVGTLDTITLAPGPGSFRPGARTTPGPVDWDSATDGRLFSEFVPGDRIDVVVTREVSIDRPCPREPVFTVDGWRHIGGQMPDRLVADAIWRSSGWIDWYDLRESIFAADRALYGSGVTGHEGTYYQAAFDNHGIDADLNAACSGCGACTCHDSWYCWLVILFC